MYLAPGRFAPIGAQYRNIDLNARVEGASPHQLISVLYEELIRALIVIKGAIRSGDLTRRGEAQSRAMTILAALETSLDHQRGGEVARSLISVYREVRRRMRDGIARGVEGPVDEARGLVSEIAEAWNAIG